MEVVTASPSNGGMPPFHDHDVREWSRLNSLTGVLERARLETDRWTANTDNSKHKYGKVVDSRTRTDADGALQQRARRELEVFHSQIPGGQVQVIKTHTVSSSRWTSSKGVAAPDVSDKRTSDFEHLQLPFHSLDLSPQKSKAVVGRSVGKRPPSRVRLKEDANGPQSPLKDPHVTAATNLHRVTRLCHQVHETAVKQAFGNYKQKDHSRQNGDGASISDLDRKPHTNLIRTKSSSSEDLLLTNQDKTTKSSEDLKDLEELQSWRRTSKLRRSFNQPKPVSIIPSVKPLDLPKNVGSVRKIKEELEKGRRLSTAYKATNLNLNALDQILQNISDTNCYSQETTSTDDQEETQIQSKQKKKNSFVTVESLQAIKNKLRPTSLSENEVCQKDSDVDDGFTTDSTITLDMPQLDHSQSSTTSSSKVKSYVFGMEAALSKKNINGTGSLESKSKLTNGNANKNEDWYNRRKSYGFEQVQNGDTSISKKVTDNSTDSGICKSNEIVLAPSLVVTSHDTDGYGSDMPSETEDKSNRVTRSISEITNSFGSVRQISSLFDQNKIKTTKFGKEETSNVWSRRLPLKENPLWSQNHEDSNSTTIRIPIKTDWDSLESDIKRHSIAVDETKYVTNNTFQPRPTSLVINDKFLSAQETEDVLSFNKRSKKVEFCKTEVHFAAESGKVNIVETDEKPPPTQNFRRRRRNSGAFESPTNFNKNGLPMLHFGESYVDKNLFGLDSDLNENKLFDREEDNHDKSIVTVNSNNQNNLSLYDDDKRDYFDNENIKGILKNKPVKPKPYHLGDNEDCFNDVTTESDKKWERLLKPFEKSEAPLWKSTVTVSNTLYPKEKQRTPLREDDFRSCSVAERIRSMETKGYSTRINFGEGEATVVENGHSAVEKPLYSRKVEDKKDEKEIKSPYGTKKSTPNQNMFKIENKPKYSPIILRKNPPAANKVDLKSAPTTTKLTSPSLVGKNSSFSESVEKSIVESTGPSTPLSLSIGSPTPEFSGVTEVKIQHKYSDVVLRQPKKSEMKYFGVKVGPDIEELKQKQPSTPKQNKLTDKPDLLPEGEKSSPHLKKPSINKPRVKSPIISKPVPKAESPIYENIPTSEHAKKKSTKYNSREFDTSVLEELTRAADEIIKAVYEHESENENTYQLSQPLDTITENKSLVQKKKSNPISRPCNAARLKRDSSTSSLESNPAATKSTSTPRKNSVQSKTSDKPKPKTNGDASSQRSSTKARRLQRASSREALLQSHGSSSEDLAQKIETTPRKPRLIKKTKTAQLTITNGIEIQKKTSAPIKERIERISGTLPEIRHKTAVSTIRSTAEKTSRDRTKLKNEDRKNISHKRETSKGSPASRNDKSHRTVTAKETSDHRASTANVKKFQR